LVNERPTDSIGRALDLGWALWVALVVSAAVAVAAVERVWWAAAFLIPFVPIAVLELRREWRDDDRATARTERIYIWGAVAWIALVFALWFAVAR
jgi:hypothetical protein